MIEHVASERTKIKCTTFKYEPVEMHNCRKMDLTKILAEKLAKIFDNT